MTSPNATSFTQIEMVCNCCSATLFTGNIAAMHQPGQHPRAEWRDDGPVTAPKGEVALHQAGWMDCEDCGSPGITVVLR